MLLERRRGWLCKQDDGAQMTAEQFLNSIRGLDCEIMVLDNKRVRMDLFNMVKISIE